MFGMALPKPFFDKLEQDGTLLLSQKEGKFVDNADSPIVRLLLVDDPYQIDTDTKHKQTTENLIYGLVSKNLTVAKEYFPPNYFDKVPYEGRPFYHGLLDCYTLLQDWYAREQGVVTPHNVERPWMWWNTKQSLYLQHAKEFGFVSAKGEMQVGDVLIFGLGSTVANHCGLYMGGNKILHHINGRLSCIEPLTEKLTHHLMQVVRYHNG